MAGLAERTHAALVKETLGEQLKLAISAVVKKRGRHCKGEAREVSPGKLELQRGKSLATLLNALPRECDHGSKCNVQGYKYSWDGYKLHIDTADCGVPASALLSSASMHDSLAAMPLALMTAARVTNCYDLMDAAYCSSVLREPSRSLKHVPL